MRDVVVVSGYFIRCPLGGYAWQVLHYLWGFRAAGFEPVFYEETGYHADCFDPLTGGMAADADAGIAAAREFFAAHGFERNWIFADAGRDRCFGRSPAESKEILAGARLTVSLATVNRLPRLTGGTRLFIDLDPGVTQIQAQTDLELREFLSEHQVHFTLGTNIGQTGCALPTAGFDWHPTRPPVALECWAPTPDDARTAFTTVGRWNEQRREMVVAGEVYSWRKRQEWLKFLALPQVTKARFEVAMDVDKVPGDRALLEQNGWTIRDPLAVSRDPDAYRTFIRDSRGEFTVAKDLNVRLGSGWFSDRGACYLAAARPVITQDTAFGRSLPVGNGVLPFLTLEEAASAVESVQQNYAQHASAARSIAAEHFAAERVVREMLRVV